MAKKRYYGKSKKLIPTEVIRKEYPSFYSEAFRKYPDDIEGIDMQIRNDMKNKTKKIARW